MKRTLIIVLAAVAITAALVFTVNATRDDSGPDGKPKSDRKSDSNINTSLHAELTITLDNMGTKESGLGIPAAIPCDKVIPASCRGTLVCDREKGSAVSWAVPACAALDKDPDSFFAAPDKGEMCTEIYGGPETARVVGELNGREIDYEIGRTNGCDISRWEQHEVLWNSPQPG